MFLFFLNDTACTEIYTLSLHDALPISIERSMRRTAAMVPNDFSSAVAVIAAIIGSPALEKSLDRKSTRLNSSHVEISYAVFCLKKKKKNKTTMFIYKVL